MTRKNWLIIAAFSATTPLSISTVLAQPTATKTEANDPKAKALLDKIEKQYNGATTLESDFKLEVKLAEQPKADVQQGKIYQSGDRYRVDMGKNFVVSDGKTVWLKMDNTVQMKNASSKSANELLSPKDLLKTIKSKEFSYGMTGESVETWSKKASLITFKSNKRNGEYTKIVVTVDQKTNYVVSAQAYGRDGGRYKLSLGQPTAGAKYDDAKFTFDKSKFPNLKVEDLRVD